MTYVRDDDSVPVTIEYPLATIDCQDSIMGRGAKDSRTSAPGFSYFVAITNESEDGPRFGTTIFLEQDLGIVSDQPFEITREAVTFNEMPADLTAVVEGQQVVIGTATVSGVVRCDSFEVVGGSSS